MIRPVDAPASQGYGENPTSVLPANHWIIKQFGNYQPDGHAGEDYAVPVGTPIRAVTSGMVVHVGFYRGTYAQNPYWIAPNFAGFCYVIDHGSFIGIYAHGKDQGNRVNVGDKVAEGQVIGLSGNTGGSTGPHLHFEALPAGFNLNGRMYGRMNPSKLFGGLAAQGTITKPKAPDAEPEQDVEMLILIKGKDDAIWVGNYVTRRQIPDLQTLKDIQYRHKTGEVKIANNGEVITGNVELAGKAV